MKVPARVCLFGGSFDPPHLSHMMAAVWALKTCPIDELWWVPTWQHAFGKSLSDYEQRVRLVRATIEGINHHMRISRIEQELGGESRTIHMVRELQRRHPGTRFSLLIGGDLVDEIPRWKDAEELLSMVDLHVIGRGGYADLETELHMPELSSSELRERLRQRDLAYCQPRMAVEALQLIDAHGWYL